MNASLAAVFGEESGNNSGSSSDETSEMSPVEEMAANATDDERGEYEDYEKAVDMLRTVNGAVRVSDNDAEKKALKGLASDLNDRKKTLADTVSGHIGNLPMFRAAFPVEDRDGFETDFYVLPKEVAAKLDIDYDDGQDSLVLPIVDETEWNPMHSIEVPDDDDEEEAPTVEDGEIDPSELTVAELKVALNEVESVTECVAIFEAEEDGKNRKTAIKAIRSRRSDLQDEDDEDDEEVEEVEDDDDDEEHEVSDDILVKAALKQKVANGEELSETEIELALSFL